MSTPRTLAIVPCYCKKFESDPNPQQERFDGE
jgi:hypothetical protein